MFTNFILSYQRSGSHYLLSCLNKHPDCEVANEILNYYKYPEIVGLTAKELLEYFYSPINRPVKIAAFHRNELVKQGFTFENNWCTLYNHLSNMQNGKFLFLRRRDMLSSFCSKKLAEIDGIWNSTELVKRVQVITVNEAELISYIAEERLWYTFWDNLLYAKQKQVFYYEDLVVNPLVLQQILWFFNLTPKHLVSDFVKVETRPLNEIITNYQELKDKGYANY